MKTLYLDCGMGAAGDMLTAALLELLPDPDAFTEKLNALGIPGVEFRREKAEKCGIVGTHMTVTVHGVEEGGEMHEHHDHDHEHDHHDHEHDHDHHDHEHDHDHHDHEHDHDYDHDHDDDHHDHDHEHIYDHDHPHGCGERCDHDHHDHPHGGEDHDHPHGGGEGHAHHGHSHTGMAGIRHIVMDHMDLPKKVAEDVMGVYEQIAEAESHAHGVPVTDIHFHEVGTMDAVADITAVCMLMNEIAPDEVVVSPVHVGCGSVRCAHGILPVPAPATAFILRGVPIYGGRIEGELCTPTGAALLKHFATRFGDMPVMTTEAIGYGMGKKDFPRANCVRAMLGETAMQTDTVTELSCNVDDMTAEETGFAMERLLEGGALEVYTVPVGMKKNRPGTLLRVMCRPEDEDRMVRLLYKHTSTIGIRKAVTSRFVLDREISSVDTKYGEVRVKTSEGYGVRRRKYEYEDIARIARENDLSLSQVRALIEDFE